MDEAATPENLKCALADIGLVQLLGDAPQEEEDAFSSVRGAGAKLEEAAISAFRRNCTKQNFKKRLEALELNQQLGNSTIPIELPAGALTLPQRPGGVGAPGRRGRIESVRVPAGTFRAEVIPEDSGEQWRTLDGAEELVEFYDPTDVFGDLADALAEAFPAVAPELERTAGDAGAAEPSTEDATAEDEPSA